MSDNRTQTEKDQESIDYYVNYVPSKAIALRIAEAQHRMYHSTKPENLVHYSWLIKILVTAKKLRIAKELELENSHETL
jgi:hypothetical protein